MSHHMTKNEPDGSVTEWESPDGKSWRMTKQTYPPKSPKPTHRNCKRRVDGILATNAHHIGAADIQILIHEVEDVRAERDDLLLEIGEAVHAWDELSPDEPMSMEFAHAMERLRDFTPFSLLRDEKKT